MPGGTQVALKGSSPSTLPGSRLAYQSVGRKSGRKILPRALLPSSSAVALARSPARTQPVLRSQSVQSNPRSQPAHLHLPLPNYPPPTYEESLRALPRTRPRAPLLSSSLVDVNTTSSSLDRSSVSSVQSHCSHHGSQSKDIMGLWLTLRTSSVGSRLAGYHQQTTPPTPTPLSSPWLSQSDYYQSLATYYRALEDNTNHNNCRNDSSDKPTDGNHCDQPWPWSVSSSLATIEPAPSPSFPGQFNEHSSHHKKKRSAWKTFLNGIVQVFGP